MEIANPVLISPEALAEMKRLDGLSVDELHRQAVRLVGQLRQNLHYDQRLVSVGCTQIELGLLALTAALRNDPLREVKP